MGAVNAFGPQDIPLLRHSTGGEVSLVYVLDAQLREERLRGEAAAQEGRGGELPGRASTHEGTGGNEGQVHLIRAGRRGFG